MKLTGPPANDHHAYLRAAVSTGFFGVCSAIIGVLKLPDATGLILAGLAFSFTAYLLMQSRRADQRGRRHG
jgi:hypothetical protein